MPANSAIKYCRRPRIKAALLGTFAALVIGGACSSDPNSPPGMDHADASVTIGDLAMTPRGARPQPEGHADASVTIGDPAACAAAVESANTAMRKLVSQTEACKTSSDCRYVDAMFADVQLGCNRCCHSIVGNPEAYEEAFKAIWTACNQAQKTSCAKENITGIACSCEAAERLVCHLGICKKASELPPCDWPANLAVLAPVPVTTCSLPAQFTACETAADCNVLPAQFHRADHEPAACIAVNASADAAAATEALALAGCVDTPAACISVPVQCRDKRCELASAAPCQTAASCGLVQPACGPCSAILDGPGETHIAAEPFCVIPGTCASTGAECLNGLCIGDAEGQQQLDSWAAMFCDAAVRCHIFGEVCADEAPQNCRAHLLDALTGGAEVMRHFLAAAACLSPGGECEKLTACLRSGAPLPRP